MMKQKNSKNVQWQWKSSTILLERKWWISKTNTARTVYNSIIAFAIVTCITLENKLLENISHSKTNSWKMTGQEWIGLWAIFVWNSVALYLAILYFKEKWLITQWTLAISLPKPLYTTPSYSEGNFIALKLRCEVRAFRAISRLHVFVSKKL